MIVAVSSFAMKGDEEMARVAGCDGVLPQNSLSSGRPLDIVARAASPRHQSPGFATELRAIFLRVHCKLCRGPSFSRMARVIRVLSVEW